MNIYIILFSVIILLNIFSLGILLWRPQRNTALIAFEKRLEERFRYSDKLLNDTINELQQKILVNFGEHRLQLNEALSKHQQVFDKRQIESLQSLQLSMQKGLEFNGNLIGLRVDKLTQQTDERLKEISGQVEKRLNEGFEKTNQTFIDVIKRLALIDEAQKKITELSSNVVDLQSILNDKRSRGAFGEVQLSALLRNAIPEAHFSLQHTLSNGNRVDCLLFLPEPTGHVAVDAKFPLESFKHMTNISATENDKKMAERQFRQDIKKHIQDIANKYILSGETADGAVMFIPSEAVFAEIHAHYPDLVELAQRSRVWLVSPTTMFAILTTARAVIKDEATRKQVHIIRDHLGYLAKDFERFQNRMDNLAKHINQANDDVIEVHKSAQKITSRFNKIEKVEVENDSLSLIENT